MNYFLKLDCSNGFKKVINVAQVIEIYPQGEGTCIQLNGGKFAVVDMSLEDVSEMLEEVLSE